MEAIATVRTQLLPLLEALVAQLDAEADPDSAGYFRMVAEQLEQADSEDDLILLFIERLGPTAPLADAAGFSALARLRLDAVLERAEQVAWAFSADGDAQ